MKAATTGERVWKNFFQGDRSEDRDVENYGKTDGDRTGDKWSFDDDSSNSDEDDNGVIMKPMVSQVLLTTLKTKSTNTAQHQISRMVEIVLENSASGNFQMLQKKDKSANTMLDLTCVLSVKDF